MISLHILLLPLLLIYCQANPYGDRFTYDTANHLRADGFVDYAVQNWGDISCNETTMGTLDMCIGYHDKWHQGFNWQIEQNYCRWCPDDGSPQTCGRHHQSPIHLQRQASLWGHEDYNECIDLHWMKYEDSSCTMSELIRNDAFTVERHALRITQPIRVNEDDTYVFQCREEGKGRWIGRLDYSKGFPEWWFLSHLDFKVPSEHVQDGKRYSGEIQMYHWYSTPEYIMDGKNEMGTVSAFLEVYDDAPPYRELDRVICMWRYYEDRTRQECGLPPIATPYPGCFPNTRGTTGKRFLKDQSRKPRHEFQTVVDILLHQAAYADHPDVTSPTFDMDEGNWRDPEEKDWEQFIKDEDAKMKDYEQSYKESVHKYGHNQTLTDLDDDMHRRLIHGDELDWFNYFPMLGVRTEYYFRYSGTQTIPPCYGNYELGSRGTTNHWRVLKDPIRIHQRQLDEMKRLLKDRIAPMDDPTESLRCQADTAAKLNETTGEVNVARPLQYKFNGHFITYCECYDWESKWPEEQEYCFNYMDDNHTRFYEHPYNFHTEGF